MYVYNKHLQDATQCILLVVYSQFEFKVFFLVKGFHTKSEDPSKSYYLPISMGRRAGIMPFSWALA